MLQTSNYSLVLLVQLLLLTFDLFVNSFSELLRTAPVIQLVLFIIQDIAILFNVIIILLMFFNTFVFQVGLVTLLLQRFKGLLIVSAFYLGLSIAFHVWVLNLRWQNSDRYVWTDGLQALFVFQRLMAVLYYYFYKRTAECLGDTRLYEDSAWLRHQFSRGRIPVTAHSDRVHRHAIHIVEFMSDCPGIQVQLRSSAGLHRKRDPQNYTSHTATGDRRLLTRLFRRYVAFLRETRRLKQHGECLQTQLEVMLQYGKCELEAMTRYTSPVNPAVFPHLTVVLLAIGMFFTAWFFVYEVTSTKYTRDIYKELLISLVASVFMGFGVLFLLLWVGIYV
ncbi:TM138 protein, partial [Polyodon spathula]|nr:TM138 protein [Polyodon spathula]